MKYWKDVVLWNTHFWKGTKIQLLERWKKYKTETKQNPYPIFKLLDAKDMKLLGQIKFLNVYCQLLYLSPADSGTNGGD